jgi:hypothetical protein
MNVHKYVSLHMKYTLDFWNFSEFQFSRLNYGKFSNFKFDGIPYSGSRVVPRR